MDDPWALATDCLMSTTVVHSINEHREATELTTHKAR